MPRLLRRLTSSLLFRVALTLSLVGLVPVGILAYRLIDINSDAMTEQVQETHGRLARSTADQIAAKVSALQALAGSVARNGALADPRSNEVRQLLAANLSAWTEAGVAAVAIVTPAGEIVLKAQLSDDRVRAWVDTLFAADANHRVLAAAVGDDFAVRISEPMTSSRGFVWLVADASFVAQALHNYELGRKAELTLATRDGEAVIGSLEGQPAELLEAARNPWVEGVDPVYFDGDVGYIGAHAPVEGTDWVVLTRQPLVVAHAVAETMRRQARFAVALVAAAVLVLSALAYASLIRPLRQLAAAQRRLAGVGGSAVGGEIGLLKASFEALEQRISEQQALDEVFLGRYQVRRVLGSGAMGTVFLGFDPKLKRPLALKTLRVDREFSSSKRKELLKRLLQEAVTTAKFNHPNIVAVYDVEEGEDAAFVAMEYVEGTSLERHVWREGRLDARQTIALGSRIASGLAVAHEYDLVHRDIKPANILLGTDGGIKITDFGIAEFLSSMSERQDVVFGTPGYLPPEALRGKGHDTSSDLFALGAVLYFSLTGDRPFEGKTVKDIIRKTLFSSPTPPTQVIGEMPRELESLIMSLLSAERSDRPASAAVVAATLERLARQTHAVWTPPEIGSGEIDFLEDGGGTSRTGAPSAPASAFLPTVQLTAERDRSA